jgi:steroid delta-isomerase-like uncharacterized protein
MRRARFIAVLLSFVLFAPLIAVSTPHAAAQAGTPSAACLDTTEEENEAIVEQFYGAVDAHDLDALKAVLAPVVTLHAVDVADAHSADEFIANIAPFFTAFPDLSDEIEALISIDNYVVGRITQSGTQTGDFLGVPATGRHATWTIIGIWRIECGKIAEEWVEVDSIGRLRQLGALPALGAATGTPASAMPTTDVPATPPAECPATTEEENEALVRRWYDEVYTQKNFDNFDEIIAPNHVRHGLNRDTTGAEARKAAVQIQQRALPDVQVAPDFLLSEGDIVVARWTATGTHTGPWENIAPTGNTVTWTGNTIYRFACGRIAEEWAQVDGLAFYEDIGVLEWPPATPAAASPAAG